MNKLKKGYMYALPHIGGVSFGTYLGEARDGPVFCGSHYARDFGELNGIWGGDVDSLFELGNGERTETEAIHFLSGVLR